MALLRRIILFVFVVIYAVVAPITVLYALGYIFIPTQQTLFQTGLVSLISEPSQATVRVNDNVIREKTPLVLRNLKPGTYELRIDLPGYQSWQRQVRIEPEHAFRFEKILLFPEKFEPQIITIRPVTKIERIQNTRNLLIAHDATASGLFLFDLDKKESRPLITEPEYAAAKVESLSIHPNGNRALIGLRRGGIFLPLFVRLENLISNLIQTEEYSSLIPEPFNHLQWSSSTGNSIFYLKANTLKRVDLEAKTVYPALLRQVRGFAVYARRLFAVDGQRRFLEMTEKGKIRNIFLDDPAKSQLVFGKDEGDFYSIHFLPKESLFYLADNTYVIFLSDHGRLTCNKLPYFLDEEVDEVALADKNLRLAYRKGSEIYVVDFEKEMETDLFESGPTPRKIYEGNKDISRLFWIYDDQYLLFLEGNQLWAQDFEGGEKPVMLFEVSNRIRDIAIDEKRGFVYFADPRTDRLSRVKLFELENLIPRLVESL